MKLGCSEANLSLNASIIFKLRLQSVKMGDQVVVHVDFASELQHLYNRISMRPTYPPKTNSEVTDLDEDAMSSIAELRDEEASDARSHRIRNHLERKYMRES